MIGTGRYQTSFYWFPAQTTLHVVAAFLVGYAIGWMLSS